MDVEREAELSKCRRELEKRRKAVRSISAQARVEVGLSELFRQVGERSERVNAGGQHADRALAHRLGVLSADRYCERGRMSRSCVGEFGLAMRELDAKVHRIGEPSFPGRGPIKESRYVPDLDEKHEFGWREKGSESTFSPVTLLPKK